MIKKEIGNTCSCYIKFAKGNRACTQPPPRSVQDRRIASSSAAVVIGPRGPPRFLCSCVPGHSSNIYPTPCHPHLSTHSPFPARQPCTSSCCLVVVSAPQRRPPSLITIASASFSFPPFCLQHRREGNHALQPACHRGPGPAGAWGAAARPQVFLHGAQQTGSRKNYHHHNGQGKDDENERSGSAAPTTITAPFSCCCPGGGGR